MFFRLIKESFGFALQALLVNRLRTFLSLLGVSIGIFSIIFVLSVVDSMEADMKESFNMIGSDVMFIQKWPMGPEDGAEEYEWWKYMRRRPPMMRDMHNLEERLQSAGAIAFSSGNESTAEYKNNFVSNAFAHGVTYKYRDVIALNIASGRYFTPIESEAGRNLAVIGHEISKQLFGELDPVGKEMKIGGLKVEVIGVLQKEGASLFGNGMDMVVMMPFQFASRIVGNENENASIAMKSTTGVSSRQLRDEVIAVMREIRGIKPKGDNDFSIIESTMISSMVDSIVSVFNIVGIVIGIFSILVGAFSIANIMFVSVSERTNIIGIQKALGAKNLFILSQFLFESIALCIIGGLMGLALVYILVKILSGTIEFDFILPFGRVIMGIGISVVVGILAGIIPALKASRLNPVDAIRSK